MKLEAGRLSLLFFKKHCLGAGCDEVYLRCYDDGNGKITLCVLSEQANGR